MEIIGRNQSFVGFRNGKRLRKKTDSTKASKSEEHIYTTNNKNIKTRYRQSTRAAANDIERN